MELVKRNGQLLTEQTDVLKPVLKLGTHSDCPYTLRLHFFSFEKIQVSHFRDPAPFYCVICFRL